VTNPTVKALDVFSNADKTKLLDNLGSKQSAPSRAYRNERPNYLIPNSPDPAPVHRMQLLSAFIEVYFPKAAQGPIGAGQTQTCWVDALPYITLTNSAYNTSLTALCVAQLGIWNHDPVLVKESFQLYGSAVRQLRKTIGCQKLLAPVATLAGTVILATYEVSAVASGTSAESKLSYCSCSRVRRDRALGGQVTFEVVVGFCNCLDQASTKLPRVISSSRTYEPPA
jgi:hypothetical protein